MENLYTQIRGFLPMYFHEEENHHYIDYLGKAFVDNMANETHQFSFISFHMLYMSFIYKTTWFLNKMNHPEAIKICAKITDPESMKFLFDYSLISEKNVMGILRGLKFHKAQIKSFALPVEYRDNCAHAVGAIHYDSRAVTRLVEEEINNVRTIFEKTKTVLSKLLAEFINNKKHWDPNERVMTTAYYQADDFIKHFALSKEDLNFLLSIEPEVLRKPSNSREVIYQKLLYIAFLCVVNNELDLEPNTAVLNAPYLIIDFDNQEDQVLEDLINDEIIYMIEDFSSIAQKEFIEALGNDPGDYGIE